MGPNTTPSCEFGGMIFHPSTDFRVLLVPMRVQPAEFSPARRNRSGGRCGLAAPAQVMGRKDLQHTVDATVLLCDSESKML